MENNSQKFIVYLTINLNNKKSMWEFIVLKLLINSTDICVMGHGFRLQAQQCHGALRCCQGYLKSTGGYIFKYIEN